MAHLAPKAHNLEPTSRGPLDDDDHDAAGGLFAEINITPLTDVILVLLIIFMVTSSAMVDAVRSGHLDIDLPAAANATAATTELPNLVVALDARGDIFVDGQAVSEADVRGLLAQTHQRAAKTMVVIQADGDLQHKKVVQMFDWVRDAGFVSVAIDTAPAGAAATP